MTLVPTPSPATPYQRLGGEAGVRRLTRRLYALMDALPQAAACRAIHPQDLGHSEQNLFEFLSGWLGGPPLFEQRHGAPMLRRRHLGFPIADAETEGWLACFRQALEETVADAGLRAFILPRVETLGGHMRNRTAA